MTPLPANDVYAICAIAVLMLSFGAMVLTGKIMNWRHERKIARKELLEDEDATTHIFKGPNGTFSVYQDFDDLTIWTVEQVFHDAEDTSAGHFMSKTNAMHAARKWAGEPEVPTHPVPNRRAAIAHSRKLA